jgi:hypothetical protein
MHIGVNDTAVHVTPVCNPTNFVDFLCEFEVIVKKALTRVSGAWGVFCMKKPEVENLVPGSELVIDKDMLGSNPVCSLASPSSRRLTLSNEMRVKHIFINF